jgi:hypothetical protein
MIGRFVGKSLALTLAAIALLGMILLVVLDLFGEHAVRQALARIPLTHEAAARAVSETLTAIPAFEGAKDITFFKRAGKPELPFTVVTGVLYADPDALAANVVASRWCYVREIAPDGVSRQIDLAEQTGNEAPIYESLTNLPASQLALFKVSSSALEAAAKTYCAFDFSVVREEAAH